MFFVLKIYFLEIFFRILTFLIYFIFRVSLISADILEIINPRWLIQDGGFTNDVTFSFEDKTKLSKSKSNTPQSSHMGYVCIGNGQRSFNYSNGFYKLNR